MGAGQSRCHEQVLIEFRIENIAIFSSDTVLMVIEMQYRGRVPMLICVMSTSTVQVHMKLCLSITFSRR